MKVGDLVGIVWNGVTKTRYHAIILEVHKRDRSKFLKEAVYTIFVFNSKRKTRIYEKDLKKFKDYLNM
tara:strand:+ start:16 stop:219 length:204 start_codon:yes stop_codon:yes gene_type:complete